MTNLSIFSLLRLCSVRQSTQEGLAAARHSVLNLLCYYSAIGTDAQVYDGVVIELLKCSKYFAHEFRRIARPCVETSSFDAGVCGDSDVHAVC